MDIIGARGSGEPAGGEFHGLGAAVHKIISIEQGYLRHRGYSYTTYAVNYPARSVDVLKPTSAEIKKFVLALMMMDFSLAKSAVEEYYHDQVKKYLASISSGVSATIGKVRSIHRACSTTQFAFAGYSQGAMVVHQALEKLSGSVTGCVKATTLLADGNRIANSKAMNFGTSLHRGEGIETWLKQTFNFGAKPHDIPTFGFGDAATASICNKSDFVCDFNFFTAIHWARGFRVHTSYAVRQPDGRYTYQKVLTRASDAVGKGLIYLLTHYSYTCS